VCVCAHDRYPSIDRDHHTSLTCTCVCYVCFHVNKKAIKNNNSARTCNQRGISIHLVSLGPPLLPHHIEPPTPTPHRPPVVVPYWWCWCCWWWWSWCCSAQTARQHMMEQLWLWTHGGGMISIHGVTCCCCCCLCCCCCCCCYDDSAPQILHAIVWAVLSCPVLSSPVLSCPCTGWAATHSVSGALLLLPPLYRTVLYRTVP